MNTFEKIIKDHLEKMAQGDAVFASKYEAKKKDIEGCCKYVTAEVSKIVQCRGKHNQSSKHHERIMETMTANMNKFRRMAQ